MIELNHGDPPRLLEKRKNHPNDKGIPKVPGKAWDSFSTEGKREILIVTDFGVTRNYGGFHRQ